MRCYEITDVQRLQGNPAPGFDASRIGKRFFAQPFVVGSSAILHHEQPIGRTMVTTPISAIHEIPGGLELHTQNTLYVLREIVLQ